MFLRSSVYHCSYIVQIKSVDPVRTLAPKMFALHMCVTVSIERSLAVFRREYSRTSDLHLTVAAGAQEKSSHFVDVIGLTYDQHPSKKLDHKGPSNSFLFFFKRYCCMSKIRNKLLYFTFFHMGSIMKKPCHILNDTRVDINALASDNLQF